MKCKAGVINTACTICAFNMTDCAGKALEPQESEEPEPPVKERKGSMRGLLVFLTVALAALYYFKFRKLKADVSGNTDLSEYDLDNEAKADDEEMEKD